MITPFGIYLIVYINKLKIKLIYFYINMLHIGRDVAKKENIDIRVGSIYRPIIIDMNGYFMVDKSTLRDMPRFN